MGKIAIYLSLSTNIYLLLIHAEKTLILLLDRI